MVKPLGDRILIKLRKKEDKTQSGIILSTKTQELSQIATVIEIGTGNNVPVKKGDNIIIRKYAGTEIRYEDTEYIILNCEDVLATF